MREGAERRLGATTATLLVVASMIGTGVFTTTGFLVRDIGNLDAVLVAWAAGGVAALFGALAYGELVAALPHNGGEYQLLSRIYHPSVGFVSGFTSFVVGFAAPLAASAIAFGEYLDAALGGGVVSKPAAAVALLLAMSFLHAFRVTLGGGVQNAFTLGKVLLVLAFVAGGLWVGDTTRLGTGSTVPFGEALVSPAFAVGLVYVSFAYSGWNAAAYVAGEVRRPARSLPVALFVGTLVVTLLYVGVNLVFLASVPASELAAANERVGHVAATGLFGESAGRLFSGMIALGLVSTVGAIVMTGPRVSEAMGRDFRRLGALGERGERGGPVLAIALQTGLAIAMAVTATFDTLLAYIGFTLSLFAFLTVAGVFVLRVREPALARPYRAFGHPLTTLGFLAVSGWMMWFTATGRPGAALAGLGTLALGGILYRVAR